MFEDKKGALVLGKGIRGSDPTSVKQKNRSEMEALFSSLCRPHNPNLIFVAFIVPRQDLRLPTHILNGESPTHSNTSGVPGASFEIKGPHDNIAMHCD